MSNSKHIPGEGHAPGVKCIVAVKLTDGQEAEIAELTKQLKATFGGLADGIRHIEKADNGKIVVIRQLVTANWRCLGCGGGIVGDPGGSKHWEVMAIDGTKSLISSYAICAPGMAVFAQEHLIPIGRDMTWDLVKERQQLTRLEPLSSPLKEFIKNNNHLID